MIPEYAVPTCGLCNQPYHLQWHVDGPYWRTISGKYAHLTLCFSCADVLAHGIDYGHLDYLAFWNEDGRVNTFIDKPEKRT
jgi:hypothetical protein